MPKKGTKYTADDVIAVKKKRSEYPMLTQADLAKICGFSETFVSMAINGHYDYLFGNPDESGKAVCDKQIESVIEEITEHELQEMLRHAELIELLERTNQLLAQLVYMKANDEDPQHKPNRETAVHFRTVASELAPRVNKKEEVSK